MRRILVGVGWFLAFFLGLFILIRLGLALVIVTRLPDLNDPAAVTRVATGFAEAHRVLIMVLDYLALLASVAGAFAGVWTGVLPGSRRKLAGAGP